MDQKTIRVIVSSKLLNHLTKKAMELTLTTFNIKCEYRTSGYGIFSIEGTDTNISIDAMVRLPFDVSVTRDQMHRLNKVLMLLEDQPITLAFESSGESRIEIRECVI